MQKQKQKQNAEHSKGEIRVRTNWLNVSWPLKILKKLDKEEENYFFKYLNADQNL